jgi:hypothetical protein
MNVCFPCRFCIFAIMRLNFKLMKNDFFSSLSDFIFCENKPEKSDIIIVPGAINYESLAHEAVLLYNS